MLYFTQEGNGVGKTWLKPKPFNNVENGMYLDGPTGISWLTMSKICVLFSRNTQLYWTKLRSDQQRV